MVDRREGPVSRPNTIQLEREVQRREKLCRTIRGPSWHYARSPDTTLSYLMRHRPLGAPSRCNGDGSNLKDCCFSEDDNRPFAKEQLRRVRKANGERERAQVASRYKGPLDYDASVPSYWPDPSDRHYQTFLRDFYMGRAVGARGHDWRPSMYTMMNAVVNNCKVTAGPLIYQAVVNQHLKKLASMDVMPCRGILLYHSTGAGKTLSAVMAIDAFRNTKKRIIVVSTPDNKLRLDDYVSDASKIPFLFQSHAPIAPRTVITSLVVEEHGGRAVAVVGLRASSATDGDDVDEATAGSSGEGSVGRKSVVRLPVSPVATPPREAIIVDELEKAYPNVRPDCLLAWEADGHWYVFRNETAPSREDIVRWLAASGASPGVSYAKGASGDREYTSSGFLTFTTLWHGVTKGLINLNDCVLIVDECQGLVRPDQESSWYKDMKALRDALDSPKYPDVFLVMMSATPGQDVEDLVRTGRMLQRRDSPLSTANKSDFEPPTAQNLDRFSKLFYGTCSFVDAYNDRSRFPMFVFEDPKRFFPLRVKCAMGERQADAFAQKLRSSSRYRAWKEEKFNNDKSLSWMDAVRRLSNVPEPFKKPAEHPSDYVDGDALKKYSTKLFELWRRLSADPAHPVPADASGRTIGAPSGTDRHFVYVPLRSIEGGLREVRYMLATARRGGETTPAFKEWTGSGTDGELAPGQRWFVVLEDKAMRSKMLTFFNGQVDACRDAPPTDRAVFLSDKAFNKGFTLCNVKFVHLFGPPTKKSDYFQTIGRTNRLCSHAVAKFPQDWKAYVVLYVSIVPERVADMVDQMKQRKRVVRKQLREGGVRTRRQSAVATEAVVQEDRPPSARPTTTIGGLTCVQDGTAGAACPSAVSDPLTGACLSPTDPQPWIRLSDGHCYVPGRKLQDYMKTRSVSPKTRVAFTPDDYILVFGVEEGRRIFSRMRPSGSGRGRVSASKGGGDALPSQRDMSADIVRMAVSDSPDEYVISNMLTRKNDMDKYKEAMQRASIDCRLLSAFHDFDETTCASPEYDKKPPWLVEWTSASRAGTKKAMAEYRALNSTTVTRGVAPGSGKKERPAFLVTYLPIKEFDALRRRIRAARKELVGRVVDNSDRIMATVRHQLRGADM